MDSSALPRQRRPWRRLGLAVLVSAALHAWLAFSLPVKPARSYRPPGSVLQARLAVAPPDLAPEPVPPGRKPQALPPAPPPEPPRAAPEVVKPAPEPARSVAEPTEPVESLHEAPPVEGPPGIAVPQIEDPEFYPARSLDQYPRPVAEVTLKYPKQAGTEEMSGTVTLLLLIDELGIVVDASVVEADPPGYFEDAAIEVFKGVLFLPGQRNGHAVKSRLVVQVAFDAKTESLRR